MFPGKLLEDLRRKKGLSRVALATAAGTYESTISRYELDASANPTWELLIGICVALEVSPDIFFRASLEASETPLPPALQQAPPLPPLDLALAPLVSIAEQQLALMQKIAQHIGV